PPYLPTSLPPHLPTNQVFGLERNGPATAKGGKNSRDNKQLLHRHCHDLKTTSDLASMRDKHHVIEEPCEGKLSRTVLKTSQRGDSLA
ncbi:MAG: HNH endonuclease, partial [Limnoraphis robusta]